MKKQIIFFLLLFSTSTFAQETIVNNSINGLFKKGLDLFDRQKYSEAQFIFEKIKINPEEISINNETLNLQKIDAEYYSAVCALELFNSDAEARLISFVNKFPENLKSKQAFFQIGRFHFRSNRFQEAKKWFLNVQDYELFGKDQIEFRFKKSYCHFLDSQFKEAKIGFTAVTKTNNKYTYPSYYYLGQIDFEAKELQAALNSFNFLKTSLTYKEIVPFYILSIFYQQKKYDSVIAFATSTEYSNTLKNLNEIREIIAFSYFKKNNYKQSSKWFNEFSKLDSLKKINSEDYYYWGFSENKLDNKDKSIEILENLQGKTDGFAQSGLILLGELFLEKEEKASARNAYGQALNSSSNKSLKEAALFNYAKLSFELNFHQIAITSLQSYISENPTGQRSNEAKSLLGEILLSTKNYKLALEILKDLQPKNANAMYAFQRVSFYRGVELFNEDNYSEALELFKQSAFIEQDKEIALMANFWIGEIHYRNKNYEASMDAFENFVMNSNARENYLFPEANYGLAYIYFYKQAFMKAELYFEAAKKQFTDSRKKGDSYLRLADCQFATKNYDRAVSNYDLAIKINSINEEYSLFQKSMILGLQNKIQEKINGLDKLIYKYPKGIYADDAIYEMSYAEFVRGSSHKAIEGFTQLGKSFPESPYKAKSYLNIGLIHYNNKEDEKALNMYKLIIKEFPSSSEAKEAYTLIKNILIENGQEDEFIAYSKSINTTETEKLNEDSISYEGAYARYIQGDCEGSSNKFNNYLLKFPNGEFKLEAYNYLGECAMKNKDLQNAIKNYQALSEINNNKYQEKALLNVSNLYFKSGDWTKAGNAFVKLSEMTQTKEIYSSSIANAMKSFEKAKMDSLSLLFAKKVIDNQSASTIDLYKAKLIRIKLTLEDSNSLEAIQGLDEIIAETKTEAGAEAQYLKAWLLFKNGNYEESINLCFNLNNSIPSYDFWIGKSFILLADNYTKQLNLFQAKTTLESIIKEYGIEDDGILEEAKQKLAVLNTRNL